MIAQGQLKDILHKKEYTIRDRLLIVFSTGGAVAKSASEVKQIAVAAGLRSAAKWSISDILKGTKGDALAVRTSNGWELTAAGHEYVLSYLLMPVKLKSQPPREQRPPSSAPSLGGTRSSHSGEPSGTSAAPSGQQAEQKFGSVWQQFHLPGRPTEHLRGIHINGDAKNSVLIVGNNNKVGGYSSGLRSEDSQRKVREPKRGPGSHGYPIRLYLCYAAEDQRYREEIERHLSTIQRQGIIESWHAGLIQPGTVRDDEQQMQLAAAQVVVLMISPDLLAADGLYAQIESSLSRSTSGEALVIPVLVRAVDLAGTLLEKIQALPKGGKPVNQWSDRDEAWKNVASEIRSVVLDMVDGHDRPASSR